MSTGTEAQAASRRLRSSKKGRSVARSPGSARSSASAIQTSPASAAAIPFSFHSAKELLEIGRREKLSIAEIVLANEDALRPRAQTEAQFRDEPFVRDLVERFDATVKTESIKPVGPSR